MYCCECQNQFSMLAYIWSLISIFPPLMTHSSSVMWATKILGAWTATWEIWNCRLILWQALCQHLWHYWRNYKPAIWVTIDSLEGKKPYYLCSENTVLYIEYGSLTTCPVFFLLAASQKTLQTWPLLKFLRWETMSYLVRYVAVVAMFVWAHLALITPLFQVQCLLRFAEILLGRHAYPFSSSVITSSLEISIWGGAVAWFFLPQMWVQW